MHTPMDATIMGSNTIHGRKGQKTVMSHPDRLVRRLDSTILVNSEGILTSDECIVKTIFIIFLWIGRMSKMESVCDMNNIFSVGCF